MKTFIFVLLFIAFILTSNSAFIIPEGRQAIITQFGRPVGETLNEPGLKFKIPFMQEVRFVDKRILTWDGYPNQIPTKDKKYIHVDTTARWKIVNPLKFIQTVQSERGARARLDSILDANTRDVISKHNLVEAVRNSNQIINTLQSKKKESKEVDDEIYGEINPIDVGREQLSQMIVAESEKELAALGIKIIDVQLRRISYEESVERKVYERMISERRRIAEKIRSIGKGEQAKIKGRMSLDLQKIQSEAYRQAQVIAGKAEAESIDIYAKSLKQAPDFYEFTRQLEAYEKSLEGKKFILSSKNRFLQGLSTK